MRTHAKRASKTCTDETRAAYRKRASQLVRRAGSEDPASLIAWFMAQQGAWKPATIRQYRAAIRQHIEDRGGGRGARKRLLAKLQGGPFPRGPGEAPRTSARKRKEVTYAEHGLLQVSLKATLKPDDDLAAECLDHNCVVFLRKIEWQTAIVTDDQLIVKNAKFTNGRSFGPYRTRLVHDYGDDNVERLRMLVARLKERAQEVGGFGLLWVRLAARVARACERVGIERISFYSTRHQGIANAKNWMSLEELAAAAGHKVTGTSQFHYASRCSGWASFVRQVCRPHDADVIRVVRSTRTEWLDKKREEHKARLRAAERRPSDDGDLAVPPQAALLRQDTTAAGLISVDPSDRYHSDAVSTASRERNAPTTLPTVALLPMPRAAAQEVQRPEHNLIQSAMTESSGMFSSSVEQVASAQVSAHRQVRTVRSAGPAPRLRLRAPDEADGDGRDLAGPQCVRPDRGQLTNEPRVPAAPPEPPEDDEPSPSYRM